MYPWSLPSPQAYFKRVAALNAKYMPADPWVDVWEGGCPTAPGVPAGKVGENPCMPMYEAFEKAAQIGGFSQWCSGCNGTSDPHYEYNDWLDNGTPVFLQPASLWYPSQKGFCNKTDGGHGARASAASLAAEADCVEGILRAVATANPQRPLFVPAYGVDNYVDVAAAMQARLAADGWEVVGAQDFARLGRQAAPGAARAVRF